MRNEFGQQTADQAQRLRELADGDSLTPRPQIIHGSPHCVLIAEFPPQGRGAPLSWYLANELLHRMRRRTKGARCLLVDLKPCGSRIEQLFHCLKSGGSRLNLPPIQPLWAETSQGRVLHPWEAQADSAMDVVAQVRGSVPTSDQFNRISEQLIRQLANRGHLGHAPYDLVVMFTSGEGICLDRACWGAADDLIVIWSPDACAPEQLDALLQSRLAPSVGLQRLSCIEARSGLGLGLGWIGLPGQRAQAAPASAATVDHELAASRRWEASWSLPLSPWPNAPSQLRGYRRAARRMAASLGRFAWQQILPRQVG